MNILFVFPIPRIKEDDMSLGRCDSPLKLEVSLGIYFGIRIGLNVSEAMDFALGLTTFDIKNDDQDEL